jgi:hypothetical protein
LFNLPLAPNNEVGDYTLAEEDIITDAPTPSTNFDFQNPIAPFAMEFWSQADTTSTRKDLYCTAAEVAKGIEDDENDTDSEGETEDYFDVDSGDDFDPESEEENAEDINIRG